LNPKAPIRRFDVFAEYNRQKAIEDGMPDDEAEGYGLWVAKVVASRGFGRSALSQPPSKLHETADAGSEGEAEAPPKPKWHSLSGKPQTDEMFEHEIVNRMGREFYISEFVPAIRDAVAADKSYTAIRDSIRKQWSI
jgi:hypothetical protein